MAQKRNRRSGVEDRWTKANGEPSANHGKGMRWRARYVGPDGKERAKGFSRKVDAQNWLNTVTTELGTGTWADPSKSRELFGSVAESWFATKATRKPKTVAGYRSILDRIVLPRWEDIRLADITYEDAQTWVSSLSEKGGGHRFSDRGLSASRVKQSYQVLDQVLRYAIRARRLTVNPAADIELPGIREPEKRYLTMRQVQELAIASGRFRTLVFVLALCGLRFGEATALRTKHVDLDSARIWVSASATHVAGKGIVETDTKNHEGRKVPIPAFLVELLRTELPTEPEALVFAGREGKHLPLGEFRWAFDRAASAVGLNGFVPHELRHTCASLAIAAGANIKVLQTLLGHKTATLTLDRYGHLYPDELGVIADALDQAAKSAADALRTEEPHAGVQALAKTR
ncbi:phage integrase family protein [Mycobacteroides abscessus subsp. abscessus]|nr:site-specific integrase [Mycobacteroides abscessus]CPV78526.1 phage integrase family protein [Mycobacteroides abscessus]SIH48818.1 phage integrase family protein [Mycobacteroides abscessus subsp. abscessus]